MLFGDRGTICEGFFSGLWLKESCWPLRLEETSSDDRGGKDMLVSGTVVLCVTATGEGLDWWTLGEFTLPFWYGLVLRGEGDCDPTFFLPKLSGRLKFVAAVINNSRINQWRTHHQVPKKRESYKGTLLFWILLSTASRNLL